MRPLPLLLAALAAFGLRDAPVPSEARKLYEAKCAACHGKTGKAVPMFRSLKVRNLDDPDWQRSKTDAEVRESIAKGRPGTVMRAFAEELKPEDIDLLVRYVRTLAPRPAPDTP